MNPSKKIMIVAGTRPEVIKMAPVYTQLQRSRSLSPVFVTTGQHREMLHQALGIFEIKPDYNLDVMSSNQGLSQLMSAVLRGMDPLLEKEAPIALLVQGDTTSVLASALAAFHKHIPVGHVEAGLRTYNYDAPFPEELNRRLVDPFARWCFAPTEKAYRNLLSESIPEDRCFITGNTGIDSLLQTARLIDESSEMPTDRKKRIGIPARWAQDGGKQNWILVTGHRRESFGCGFEAICRALLRIVDNHPDVKIIYPVHLNPRVRDTVFSLLGSNPSIALIDPLDYRDFVWLMKSSKLILSDSGGIQEEAPSLRKRVIVMRECTERQEGVDAGTSILTGADEDQITAAVAEELERLRKAGDEASFPPNPYGDGHASGRICRQLEEDLV